MAIHFFAEEITFSLPNEPKVIAWLDQIATNHNHQVEELNYIFCTDDYLLEINRTHLDHDYYTDIITFDNSDTANQLEGDIFISIDRVRENAHHHSTTFEDELSRVMAHGLLHLLGYSDKTDDEQKEMREKENACLSLLSN